MKVYVLMWQWWEDYEVLGVYSTREKAEEHEQKFSSDPDYSGSYEVYECELDGEPK